MTTLGGLDPSRSLLPTGGGVIHVMSGGNMDSSLLPKAVANIHVMTGGVDPDPTNAPQVNAPQANAPQANAPQVNAPEVNAPEVNAPQVNAPQANAPQANAPQVNAPQANAPQANAPQANAPQANAPQANAPQVNAPEVQPEDLIQIKSTSEAPLVSTSSPASSDEKKEESVKTNTISTTNAKPKRKPEAPLSEDEKRITLFGERLILKKPRNNSTEFDTNQTHVLRLFGLNAASLDMKRRVLNALYDGSCDTTRSLITMRSCEPFRQIVRSLALRYLSKMNGEYVDEIEEVSEQTKEENEESEQSQQAITVSSNDAKKREMEEKLAIMEDDRITVMGIPNPDPAISCYCNSTIQMLYSIPEVRTAILSYSCQVPFTTEDMKEEKQNNEGVVCALQVVFRSLTAQVDKIQSYRSSINHPNPVLSSNDVEKVQYIMRQFASYKKSQPTARQDANELVAYLFDEVFSHIKELNNISSYFTVNHVKIIVPSGNSSPPNSNPGDATQVSFIPLSYDELITLIENDSKQFEEEKKEYTERNTISVKSLIDAHQYSRASQTLQGVNEKYDIQPVDTNRYLLFDLSKSSKNSTVKLNVSPRITIKNKYYVFLGSILYTPRNNGHYTYHLIDSSRIREQGDKPVLEGVPYIKYNDSAVITGSNEASDDQFPLSEQARLLVYRSEDAMDAWKANIETQRASVASVVEEPAPTLPSGEPYRMELQSKIPEEVREAINEISTMSIDTLLPEFGDRTNEIDEKMTELSNTLDEIKTRIESYISQYKNEQSSQEQKNAYQEIEHDIETMYEKVNAIEQLLFSRQQDTIISILDYVSSNRIDLIKKTATFQQHLFKTKAIILQDEGKNAEDGKKWSSLYNVLAVRREDRKAVLEPLYQSYAMLVSLFEQDFSKKNEEIKEIQTRFAELLHTKLEPLLQSIEARQNIHSNEGYRNEFLGGFTIQSGQQYYERMVAEEDYKEIQLEMNNRLESIQTLQAELASISSHMTSSSSSSASAHPTSEASQSAVDELPLINISDIPSSDTSSASSASSSNQPIQQGGATADEIVPYLEKLMVSYTEIHEQLHSILDKKQNYIENYEQKQIQIPYAELVTKSHDHKEMNEASILEPITKLRRNMIRLEVLGEIDTSEREFWSRVEEENKAEHSSLQSIVDAIRTSYNEVSSSPSNDMANAFYHYLLAITMVEPDKSLRDIHQNMLDLYAPSQAHIQEWMNQSFNLSDIDHLISDLDKRIQDYNAIIQSKQNYDSLPPLRIQIQQQIIDLSAQLTEKNTQLTSSLQTTVLESLTNELQHIISIYEKNKENFLENYHRFYIPRSFTYLSQDLQIISTVEKEKTEGVLNTISGILQQWYVFFTNTYDPVYRAYEQSIQDSQKKVDASTQTFHNITMGILPFNSNSTIIPEEYARNYKAQLLGDQSELLQEDEKKDELPPFEAMNEVQSIKNEINEAKNDLDNEKEEFINSSITLNVSTQYPQKASQVISKYDVISDRIHHYIAALTQRKKEIEDEETKLSEYTEALSEKIMDEMSKNKERLNLSSADATSLSRVIAEVHVREEVNRQVQEKKDHLKTQRERLESERMVYINELSDITMEKETMNREKEEIVKQLDVRRQLKEEESSYLESVAHYSNEEEKEEKEKEKLQAQIDAARKEIKMERKIAKLQAVIREIEEKQGMVSNENQSSVGPILEEKRQRLRSLEELMQEQVRLRGNLPRNNQRIQNTKTYPEKDEKEESNRDDKLPSSIRDMDQIRTYMKDLYGLELSAEQTKALITEIKRSKEPLFTIEDIITADDLFHVIYESAVKSHIPISRDQNKYLKHIDEIHKEYENDREGMDFYQRIIGDQSTVSLFSIPDEETDYINSIHDQLERANQLIRDAMDGPEFDQKMMEEIEKVSESIKSTKQRTLIDLAKRHKKGEISHEEYVSYRLHLELLYALTESPLKDDFIQFYKYVYDTKKQEEEKLEQNRLAREAEEEKKQQQEDNRRQQLKQEHYEQTRATIKSLLRDVRSHLSFIQKTKNLPKEMKDLSIELKGLYELIQNYSKQYKNAEDKSAPVFSTLMPNKIKEALSQLRPYLDSDQSIIKRPEYDMIYRTIQELSSSEQEIIEWIKEAKNQNRANNEKNYRSFKEEYTLEEKRIEQERLEEEKKQQDAEEEKKRQQIEMERAEEEKQLAIQKEEEDRIAKQKANRNAAIRAEKEKIHKTKLDQIEREILQKSSEIDDIKQSLIAYDAIKGSSAFVSHYQKLFKRGKIDAKKQAYVQRIFGPNILQLPPSQLPKLTSPQLSNLILLLKDAINPDQGRLEQEIQELDQQREKLLRGNNNKGKNKSLKNSIIHMTIEENKQTLEKLPQKMKEINETITQLTFAKNHMKPNEPLSKQTRDYLVDIMKKYDYLSDKSINVFKQNASMSSGKIIPLIDNFIEKLRDQLAESEESIESLEKKIASTEYQLRENPSYQQKNIETLGNLEKSLTISKINEITDKVISVMKFYPDVSQEYIARMTSIKNDNTLSDNDKTRNLSIIIQEFMQYLTDIQAEKAPHVSNKALKQQAYFGMYPGRGNSKNVKNSKIPRPPVKSSTVNKSRLKGGSLKKKKLKRTRKVKK